MIKLLITSAFVDNFRGKNMKFVQFFWTFRKKIVSLPPELWHLLPNHERIDLYNSKIDE